MKVISFTFYWAIFCVRSCQTESCLQKLSCSILNSTQVTEFTVCVRVCVCVGMLVVCVHNLYMCVANADLNFSVFRGHTESVMEAC